jgi:hypothetical protein
VPGRGPGLPGLKAGEEQGQPSQEAGRRGTTSGSADPSQRCGNQDLATLRRRRCLKGWQEYRSRLVETLDQDLFDHLVMAYAQLEIDRMRFSMFAKRVPPDDQMPIPEALGVWHSFYELGRLRRRLDAGGIGWIDEMDDPVRPQVESLLQQIDPLGDDVLPMDARVAMLREYATRISALKEDILPSGWLSR